MKMKTRPSQMIGGSTAVSGSEWELRPGGMLVQKRNPDSDRSSIPPPTIRVRVKYGSTYHEISISSQATFGDLKKMLTGLTGLHHEDQKLIFKDKERDSKSFLDICGVKDKSKIVLVEDPICQDKRFLEMRKTAKMDKASKSISDISQEVDRLATQVTALESVVTSGGKVAEKTVLNLIELLMNQLLKLDAVVADGDVKLQRKMQVRRVQKYVETLDMLKLKNSATTSNGNHTPRQQLSHSNGHHRQPSGHSLGNREEEKRPRLVIQQQTSTKGAVVVTTKWETFDSAPPSSAASSGSNYSNTNNKNKNISVDHQPRSPWRLFD